MASYEVTLLDSSGEPVGRGTLVRDDALLVSPEFAPTLLGDVIGVLASSPAPLRVESPVDVLTARIGDEQRSTIGSAHVAVAPGAPPLVGLRLQDPVDSEPARRDELPDDLGESVAHHVDAAERFPDRRTTGPVQRGRGAGPASPPAGVPPEAAFFPCVILPRLCQGHIAQPGRDPLEQ